MRFFSGEGTHLGLVTALPQQSFEALCKDVIEKPIRLRLTREQFHALPKKLTKAEQDADPDATDQQRAKRVRYITPGAFKSTPSQRVTENVVRCNLLALDIDTSEEAKRLLKQNWSDCLGELGFVVWHTASSTPEAPRLRVIVSAEGITPERYTHAARTIAEMIGLTKVDNSVYFHSHQPMFLPTKFAGDTENPIVASNPTGDPFLGVDIIEDDESALVDSMPKVTGDQVADLEYLRTPLEGVTLADAQEAISHLDPDLPMQQWIEVAAGLKHQFDSEEAYRIWDEWSSKGKKYVDSQETKYRWNSLKAQPVDRMPITIRSLFKQAQARGWANPALAKRQHAEALAWLKSPQRSAEELLDQGAKRIAKIGPTLGQLERKTLMVALKDTLAARDVPLPLPDIKKAVRQLELEAARTTGIPPWAKGLCYITSLNLFYRSSVDRRFSPEVLDLMYSTPPIGDEKPIRPRDYVVQIVGCPQVEAMRYDPSRGSKRYYTEDNVPYVNTYRPSFAPPEPERADEAGEIFLGHIKNLVAEPEHQRTLVDFLAYHVQHPGKKIRWATLLQGAQGIGKTFLAVAMARVLGRRNVCKLAASNVINGDHNDWAYGSQLVTMEEVRVVGHNRHSVMDKIKPCISDDDISLRAMYEGVRTVPNITNYLMFTNHHDSLAIDDSDRRYFVLASPLQRVEQIRALGGTKYFDKIFGMLRDNPGGLRAWFEQWSISDSFEPEGRAPITKYLFDLAENAATPLATAVKHCIEDEPHPLVRKDLLSLACLRGSLDSSHLPDFSDQALASVLRELGWFKYNRIMVDGAKHQIWIKRQFPDVRGTAEARVKFL